MLAPLFAVLAGYLIGAIPFAYLIVRARKGIDIRTVGSGNVGATNAGRVLGFRYFLLCFALDLMKGLVPTWGLPRLVAWAAGSPPAWLPVLVALATILGHNFPVYLAFKGGKGVATSFGALLALDPVASLGALLAFVVFLLVTRFVSLSSVLGAIVFVLVHFAQVEHPWDRDQRAMSVVTLALLAMLTARHRANFTRIARGTEPKVRFGRRAERPPGVPTTRSSGHGEGNRGPGAEP